MTAFPSPSDRQHTRDRDGAVRTLAVWQHERGRAAVLAWMRGQREILKGVR
jgi:hypothetical protein